MIADHESDSYDSALVFGTGACTVETGSARDFETLYAVYRWDCDFPQIYYVRNRFLLPAMGTWNKLQSFEMPGCALQVGTYPNLAVQ